MLHHIIRQFLNHQVIESLAIKIYTHHLELILQQLNEGGTAVCSLFNAINYQIILMEL